MAIPAANLMLPPYRQQILQAYREMPDSDKKQFIAGFDKLTCLWVLWGLEDSQSINFRDAAEKRHSLLAYKTLHLLWFDKLPERDDQPFRLFVAGTATEFITSQQILETYALSIEALNTQCKRMRSPGWLNDEQTIAITVSINSFPNREAV